MGGEKPMLDRLLLEIFSRPKATVLLSGIVASVVLSGAVAAGGGYGAGP